MNNKLFLGKLYMGGIKGNAINKKNQTNVGEMSKIDVLIIVHNEHKGFVRNPPRFFRLSRDSRHVRRPGPDEVATSTTRSGFSGSRPSQPRGPARPSPAYMHESHAVPSWMLVLEIGLYSLIHSFND